MVLDYGISSGETLKFHAERGPFTYFGRIYLFFTLLHCSKKISFYYYSVEQS